MTTEPAAGNGHHFVKSTGDTLFPGPLDSLPYPSQPVSIAQATQAMYDDGYVIFPGVLSPAEVAELRSRMDAMGGPDEQYFVKNWCFNKHIISDFSQNPDLLDYIDRPGVVDVAEAIHSGTDSGPAHVTGGTSWITGAGRAMGVHVDYLPVALPEEVHADPQVRVPIFTSTAHFYLNDMVAELGPTTVIPGSHRAGRPPHNETSWHGILPQAVMVKAGDVCLFRGDLWHGAWKNTCETDRRYMMQVHYGHGYIGKGYPAMRYASLYNPAVLEKAAPRQRQLLGG